MTAPHPRRRTLGWAWPRVSAAFVREALSAHSALGLAVSALIYLVCVSGTLAVFVAELRAWEQPHPKGPVSVRAIDTALIQAQQRAGRGGTLYLMLPPMEAGRARLETINGDGRASAAVARDGRLLGALKTPFSDFVDGLHMYLCLPTTAGSILVGLIGAALLSLLISGLLAHPRIFRDAFALRWGGARRLQEADLHNRLSVWGLPFHLTVTLTGAFFGLSNLLMLAMALATHSGDTSRIFSLLEGPSPPRDERPAPPPPSIEALLRSAGGSQDPRQITYVGIQGVGTRGAQISVEIAAPGRLIRGERHIFDATGRYLGAAGEADGPLGRQVYAAAASLHFGAFGGLAVRLAYGVLGLALCVICAGGISIWLARRRDQGRAAARLERLWPGVVWGVLTALAAAAIGALASGLQPLAVFGSILLLVIGGAMAQPDGPAASRFGRFSLMAGLAALAITHLIRFRMSLDGTGAAIDVLCLCAGVGLGLSLRRVSGFSRLSP